MAADIRLSRERERERGVQGPTNGTSSVAFELLIINCHIEFINLFIFNCLTSNFHFPKHIFGKQNRTAVSGRVSLVLDFKLTRKMMTCYLQNRLIFEVRTLWTSILKCEFPTKGIKLTRFILFEVLRVPQLWGTSV